MCIIKALLFHKAVHFNCYPDCPCCPSHFEKHWLGNLGCQNSSKEVHPTLINYSLDHSLSLTLLIHVSQQLTHTENEWCISLLNPYTAGVIGWISDSYCSLKPLCSGMGEVVPARTSPTLLPPSPRTMLSLSCFKVLQCINCHD